ncbi:MAG: hypothetical protein Q9179_004153 [Wetmoreana sp. 5 TL-2023]
MKKKATKLRFMATKNRNDTKVAPKHSIVNETKVEIETVKHDNTFIDVQGVEDVVNSVSGEGDDAEAGVCREMGQDASVDCRKVRELDKSTGVNRRDETDRKRGKETIADDNTIGSTK